MNVKRASFWVLLVIISGISAAVYDAVCRWREVPKEKRGTVIKGLIGLAIVFVVGIITGVALTLQSQD